MRIENKNDYSFIYRTLGYALLWTSSYPLPLEGGGGGAGYFALHRSVASPLQTARRKDPRRTPAERGQSASSGQPTALRGFKRGLGVGGRCKCRLPEGSLATAALTKTQRLVAHSGRLGGEARARKRLNIKNTLPLSIYTLSTVDIATPIDVRPGAQGERRCFCHRKFYSQSTDAGRSNQHNGSLIEYITYTSKF